MNEVEARSRPLKTLYAYVPTRRVGTRCFAGDHVVCPRPEGTREGLEDREREQENNRILEVYLGPRLWSRCVVELALFQRIGRNFGIFFWHTVKRLSRRGKGWRRPRARAGEEDK